MSRTSRIAGAVIGAVALAGSLAACGGDSLEKEGGSDTGAGADSKKGSLVVGAAGFTESKVLAELYAQILGDAGYDTSVTTVKNRELYEPSLEKGRSTSSRNTRRRSRNSSTPRSTVRRRRRRSRSPRVTWRPPSPLWRSSPARSG